MRSSASITETRSRSFKPHGARPSVSVVVVWRGDSRELDKRLHTWTAGSSRETVELILVRSCTTPERLRLERANPGLRLIPGASDQDLASLRQAGVSAARGDIIVVLDDVHAAAPSWRDHLPLSDVAREERAVDWSVFTATLDASALPRTARAPRGSGEAGLVARDPD